MWQFLPSGVPDRFLLCLGRIHGTYGFTISCSTFVGVHLRGFDRRLCRPNVMLSANGMMPPDDT